MHVRALCAFFSAAALSALAAQPFKTSSDRPPRKVIVGTAMQAFWGEYPGLDKRLQQLTGLVDRMAEQSQTKYGRGIDLAVLPEAAVTGEDSAGALPFDGPVTDAFSRKARERRCYIIVPMFLLEDKEKRIYSNAAVLVGRDGQVAGIYRKLHLAVHTGSDSMEGGTTPGKELPVFDCDFGKLGIQICFDIEFDDAWKELARKGAELIAWPTQSPQTAHPALRAQEGRCYIVSSTWRHNASVFEPTGKITAQIKPPEQVLAQEFDLSYAIVPWSPQLQNGAALAKKYGDKVGFHYYEDEDAGIFWSNDPRVTIRRMLLSIRVAEAEEELLRIRKLYGRAGVPSF